MCWNRNKPKQEDVIDFVPSNVPKFKYGKLHKFFKNIVYKEYHAIEGNLVLFRVVSEQVNEKDFLPISTEKIIGDEIPTKEDIDMRSLSLFNTIEACELMAIKKYESEIERFGAEQAEEWKNNHGYVIEIILTHEDGYVDDFDKKGHINFAPFNTFNHYKRVNKNNMKSINYQQPHVKMGILQGGDGNNYVSLYYDGSKKYSLEVVNEHHDGFININNLSTSDVLNYIHGRIKLSQLASKKGTTITSTHGIYGYISKKYNIDSNRILARLEAERKNLSWNRIIQMFKR